MSWAILSSLSPSIRDTKKKFWFCDNPAIKGKKAMLPLSLKKQILGKQIVCIEWVLRGPTTRFLTVAPASRYENLEESWERELFQVMSIESQAQNPD